MYTQWQKYYYPPKKGNSDIAHSNHFLSLLNSWNTIYSILSIILYKKNDENQYRNECMNYFLSVWGGWQYLCKPLYGSEDTLIHIVSSKILTKYLLKQKNKLKSIKTGVHCIK